MTPLLVAVGSGLGNILHTTPLIRFLARRLGRPVAVMSERGRWLQRGDGLRKAFVRHGAQRMRRQPQARAIGGAMRRKLFQQRQHRLARFEQGDDMQARMPVRIRVVAALAHASAQPAREARLRSLSVSCFLRRRISFGVTSTSSSSSMKSRRCSA